MLPNNLITCDASYMFARCPLIGIIFPATITSIYSHFMIEECTKLEYIKCLSEKPPTIRETTLQRANDTYSIYVPDASLNAYRTASYWRDYASRIQAIID